MLIHPWDSVEDWRGLVPGNDFGQLVTVGEVDGWPVIVPTHFVVEGDEVLLHLARPNPVWAALAQDDRVVMAMTGDYAYVDASMNAGPGTDPDLGVPTSYYTALQLRGRATVVDDPEAKAAILARQLLHFEPEGSTRVTPTTDVESDRRQLPAIRGLRIRIQDVRAKQKYGGNKSVEERTAIASRLAERDAAGDRGVRARLLERTEVVE
ncbi:FMN-binding negative transcriptional regulator [Nocardioides sp. JQ2195]|uniref:FMN-binding negative transcriptional regulator n=1 Tax=Nocardioides sp. JQ2195 TaxID=2592334 RepID=UPI00143E4289|nr:FMN-binding negative transcriptional regulator [Nocardioides sp. JQ2195]QIX27539.1 FMN-binding negative transcriptional regulator [Nocardioides sp. JQ2195]